MKIPCLKKHPYFDKRYIQVSPAQRYDPVSFNACGKSLIYIRKKSSPNTDPCGTPQFISPVSERTFSSVTKNFLIERYN